MNKKCDKCIGFNWEESLERMRQEQEETRKELEEFKELLKDWNTEGDRVWEFFYFLEHKIQDETTIEEMNKYADDGIMSEGMEYWIEQYCKEKGLNNE